MLYICLCAASVGRGRRASALHAHGERSICSARVACCGACCSPRRRSGRLPHPRGPSARVSVTSRTATATRRSTRAAAGAAPRTSARQQRWPAVRASGVTGVTHPCTTGPLTPAPSPSSPLHQRAVNAARVGAPCSARIAHAVTRILQSRVTRILESTRVRS
jgi:hypothetical protein